MAQVDRGFLLQVQRDNSKVATSSEWAEEVDINWDDLCAECRRWAVLGAEADALLPRQLIVAFHLGYEVRRAQEREQRIDEAEGQGRR